MVEANLEEVVMKLKHLKGLVEKLKEDPQGKAMMAETPGRKCLVKKKGTKSKPIPLGKCACPSCGSTATTDKHLAYCREHTPVVFEEVFKQASREAFKIASSNKSSDCEIILPTFQALPDQEEDEEKMHQTAYYEILPDLLFIEENLTPILWKHTKQPIAEVFKGLSMIRLGIEEYKAHFNPLPHFLRALVVLYLPRVVEAMIPYIDWAWDHRNDLRDLLSVFQYYVMPVLAKLPSTVFAGIMILFLTLGISVVAYDQGYELVIGLGLLAGGLASLPFVPVAALLAPVATAGVGLVSYGIFRYTVGKSPPREWELLPPPQEVWNILFR